MGQRYCIDPVRLVLVSETEDTLMLTDINQHRRVSLTPMLLLRPGLGRVPTRFNPGSLKFCVVDTGTQMLHRCPYRQFRRRKAVLAFRRIILNMPVSATFR